MTVDEAFSIINNLDVPDGLKRKFAPGYSLLLLDRSGEIVKIERFKEPPSESEQQEILNWRDGCIAIDGSPGMDESPQALQKRITDRMWIFEKLMRKPQA